jgi:hypothetical protein
MPKLALAVAVTACLLAPFAFAQSKPAETSVQSATATCRPATTLDELTKALDDAVSGPGNKDRTCLRDLMLTDARPFRTLYFAHGPVSRHAG